MKKILFVCLGNICRSPMAHGIVRDAADRHNIDVELDSAGTSAYHVGEAPDPRAQKTLEEKGIDISDLRARQFTEADFDRFDVIYTMDEANYNNILLLAGDENEESKVKYFLDELHPGERRSVPDPYFGGDDGFENVYRMLKGASDELIKKLQ